MEIATSSDAPASYWDLARPRDLTRLSIENLRCELSCPEVLLYFSATEATELFGILNSVLQSTAILDVWPESSFIFSTLCLDAAWTFYSSGSEGSESSHVMLRLELYSGFLLALDCSLSVTEGLNMWENMWLSTSLWLPLVWGCLLAIVALVPFDASSRSEVLLLF